MKGVWTASLSVGEEYARSEGERWVHPRSGFMIGGDSKRSGRVVLDPEFNVNVNVE